MDDSASKAGAVNAPLRAALLDYCQAPGKYQVALRQPEVLFAELREVLQLAVGRQGGAEAGSGEKPSALRNAARFFIRTALLYPGADHYALLGVDRQVVNADLKDRYRLMMRLLHPDFSGPDAGTWPADAAVRVNQAYDTLSSAVQRRLYDESLAPVQSTSSVGGMDLRRARTIPIRPAAADMRQSRFKTLALACAAAGAALVVVVLFGTGSSEPVHLVQRDRAEPAAVNAALQEPPASTSPVLAKLQELLSQVPALPAAPVARSTPPSPAPQRMAVASPPSQPVAQPAATPATAIEVPDVRAERVAQSTGPSPVSAPLPSPEPKPELILATVATAAPAPVAVATPPPPVVAAAVQTAPVPRPAPKPGPTLVEAQPLLSQLLQVMESGRGERILSLLDAEARSKPAAQALSRQYDSLIDGARPVRVSHVELKAEPGDGRLLVVGYLRVLAGEQAIGALGKKMVLRAEFASREGTVVITGLSGGPVN